MADSAWVNLPVTATSLCWASMCRILSRANRSSSTITFRILEILVVLSCLHISPFRHRPEWNRNHYFATGGRGRLHYDQMVVVVPFQAAARVTESYSIPVRRGRLVLQAGPVVPYAHH